LGDASSADAHTGDGLSPNYQQLGSQNETIQIASVRTPAGLTKLPLVKLLFISRSPFSFAERICG
jgi:hypothetical protein